MTSILILPAARNEHGIDFFGIEYGMSIIELDNIIGNNEFVNVSTLTHTLMLLWDKVLPL